MSLERCILGTAGLGGVWGPVDQQESIGALLLALENGIPAIDTAPAYGDAEKYVGEVLRQWNGPLPQVSTKVGRLKSYRADEGYYDYSDDGMQRSVEQSLSTLGIPAIDILFLHDPACIEKKEAARVIRSLMAFKEKGYAKKIGLGGNAPDWFAPYLQPEIFDVVMEFNKLNACNSLALTEQLPYCLAKNIEYFVASPLNMGLLGDRFESYVNQPPEWLSIDMVEAAMSVKEIAERYELVLRTLAHRFLLSLPFPFRIVIGASNRQQLTQTMTDFSEGSLPTAVIEELLTNTKRKTA
jgi:D-threo-aldose 1-dehydrogenase